MPAREKKKLRIRLIHWNKTEVIPYLHLLKEAGHRVDHYPEFKPQMMREWRAAPPDVFVIDLSRLPSHGREIAIALRQSKGTRPIPIVFCQGEDDKVAKTQVLLPDAHYCSLSQLNATLSGLRPAEQPVVPTAMMDRYTSRTTCQKLGIKAGDRVCLLEPPRDMPEALGPLPEEVVWVESLPAAVTLLFATDPSALRQQLSQMRSTAAKTKFWVCWKKGKGKDSGVSETLVRETGISLGLVDYKICSVSSVWSGLLFAAKNRA